MPIVTADSYGIDYTGATDVGTALANAINANSGNTFQLHPNGRYLLNTNINSYGTIWTAGNIVIEGQDAALFRNVKRDNGYAPHYNMVTIYGNAGPVTVADLHLYGYRKDPYPGNELTTVAGTPTPSGATVQLDAVNEEVRLPQVPLDWVRFSGEPINSYHDWETPFYFRDPDGYVQFDFLLFSSVALDTSGAVLSIINDETGAVLASSTVSPTLVPTTYTLRWLLPDAHLGTRLRVTVRKATGGNTLTVQSITAYGECGYRNKNATGADHNHNASSLYSDGNIVLKGGNEFSDLLVPATVTGNMTLDNVSTEGSDGDGINLSSMGGGGTLTLTNFYSRGAGRQGITNPLPTTVIQDSIVRETGRSGIDFEPTGGGVGGITLERVDFINTRNYTVAAANYGVISDVHFTDCTSTNAGMGPWYGGGWWITINNFTHSNTYRDEADRVLNGGSAGVDAIIRGFNITANGFTTDIGFWLAAGDNIVITGAQADNEPAIVDATNSSVSFMGPPAEGTAAFDVGGDDLFVPSTVQVFAPEFPAFPQTVTLPGVAAVGAFQDDAFQNEVFQDALSGGGYIAYVGHTFTPVLTGQTVSAFVYLTGTGGWDSDEITWDDPVAEWDAAGLGGQIDQGGHVFTPQFQFTKVLLGFINQSPVLFTPSPGASSFGPLPFINRRGFTYTPEKVTESITVGLISNVGTTFTPVVQAPQTVDLNLIDQTPVLFEFQLNPQEMELPFINRRGFTYTPERVTEQVDLDLIASTVAVFAPKLDAIALPFISQTPVVFEPVNVIFNPDDVELDLIDQTPVVFEPPLFLIPFQQTIRLDETAEQFIDNTGHVFQFASVEVAQPQSVFIGFINQRGVALQLRVFIPTRPTIVLHARYDPVSVKHAKYDPVILKHAQNTRQG
jgi:hypothetical protein